MLAKEYTEGMKAPRGVKDYNPPEGWYKSEKLDGYRAQTDNRMILSNHVMVNHTIVPNGLWMLCVLMV